MRKRRRQRQTNARRRLSLASHLASGLGLLAFSICSPWALFIQASCLLDRVSAATTDHSNKPYREENDDAVCLQADNDETNEEIQLDSDDESHAPSDPPPSSLSIQQLQNAWWKSMKTLDDGIKGVIPAQTLQWFKRIKDGSAIPRQDSFWAALSVKKRHAFLDKSPEQQRLGHSCYIDEDCSIQFVDHYQKEIEQLDNDAFVHSYPGMRFHVFYPKLKKADEFGGECWSAAERRQRNLPSEWSTSHGPQLLFDRAYQLLEPMYMELGVAPKHRLDFAYTPVNYYAQYYLPTGTEGSYYSSGYPKRPHNIDYQSDSFSHERVVSSEDDSCTALEMASRENCKSIDQDDTSSFRWWKWWFSFANPWWRGKGDPKDFNYRMGSTAFAGGSHGQVWRGRRVCDHQHHKTSFFKADDQEEDSWESMECDEDRPLIFKRLKVEEGFRLLEAGLREIYFGQLIKNLPDEGEKDLFSTYVDHFFRELPTRAPGSRKKELELWIVFEDSGPSLRSYLYTPITSSGGFVLYQHSPLWTQLRMTSRDSKKSEHTKSDEGTSSDAVLPGAIHGESAQQKDHSYRSRVPRIGQQILRRILEQILRAAAVLHESGIVHRDIKPSNVLCSTEDSLHNVLELERVPLIHCRLIDFSSGWDHYTRDNLYTKGPSPLEQTDEYAPPESYVGPGWVPFDHRRPESYDSWSIGVLALELLLGSPNVFSVDQRTTFLLTTKMKKEGATDHEVQRALYLASLSQFCIYVPNSPSNGVNQMDWPLRRGDPLHKTKVKDSCTLQDFHKALRARDPLGIGFDSSSDLLLHLIWQLLEWDPVERITAAEALQHPFFHELSFNASSIVFPGRHNALEPQMLDPRLDFKVDDTVNEFVCPKCGRVFTDWQSCNRHANSRRHAKFCTYDRSILPTCIGTHSMLPAHQSSGYCDLQGRRPTIEDFHSVRLYADVQFYGIFDGHSGNFASKYVSSTLFERLMRSLPELTVPAVKSDDWKLEIEKNVTKAYYETHSGFLEALSMSPSMDQSGTTATAMLVSDNLVILSSIGDSRAVLSAFQKDGSVTAIQLTTDHIASNSTERALVEERGGFVSNASGKRIARVNGTLAVTRSIGDSALAPVLSRTPHVISMSRSEVQSLCGSDIPSPTGAKIPCFVILASDGLWDVMTNQEAVDMVYEVASSYASDASHVISENGGLYQEAAEMLAVEAYVRGSTDNIGVCVVALSAED